MSLSALLQAAERYAAPQEAVGLMVARADGVHVVRVVVSKEVVAHVTAPTRDEAVSLALDALDDSRFVEAFAEACGA